MLLRAAVVLVVVLVMVGAAAGNSIIFEDYTSDVHFTLPPGLNNPNRNDMTYYTSQPGSVNIGLFWNNDATDDFGIALSSLPELSLTSLNNQAQCGLAPTGVTLNVSNPQCNYTLSWKVPFNGILSITYSTGSSPGQPSSQDISILFSSASIIGDPQFVGLRGQQYQIHGIDGAVYNIITEADTQVNARFVFLTQGDCPVFDGLQDSNCWSHPGSYLGALSYQQVVDGKLHRALLTAGTAKAGFAGVEVDGNEVAVGQTVTFGSFIVSRLSSHAVNVQTTHFSFELTNSDLFINQALRSRVPLSQLKGAHGLLGQTHSAKTYNTAIRHIEGRVDDYVICDDDVYGTDFLYNKFQL